jgi:prepilin-type processing-associated H-X9-DG protein
MRADCPTISIGAPWRWERSDDPRCQVMREPGMQPIESTTTRVRPIIARLAVPAMMGIGFLAGLISGPHVLPDLDLDVYYISPSARIVYWGFLWALGFGFFGATVRLALADHRRIPPASPQQRSPSRLKRRLLGTILGSLTAFVLWSRIFSPREAAVRSHCAYNLQSIMRAMYSYHEDFGCLPPAYIRDEKGNPKHSWRMLILPYLDRERPSEGLKRLYDSYDFSEPWDGPHNRKLANRMPIVYGCRNDRDRRASKTSYLAITGEHSAFPGSRSIRFDEIRDGRSNTILVIETGNSGINWMEPRDYPIEQLRFESRQAPHPRLGDHWPGGRNAGFADGSVRLLRQGEIGDEILKALATIDGGEEIDRGLW